MGSSDPAKKKAKKKFSIFRRRNSKRDLTVEGTAPAAGALTQAVDFLPAIPASPAEGKQQYRQDIKSKQWHAVDGVGGNASGFPGEVHVGDSPGGNVSAVTHGTGMPSSASYLGPPAPQSYGGYATPERKGRGGGGGGGDGGGRNRHHPTALLPVMAGDETTVGDGSGLLPAPAPSLGVAATRSSRKSVGGAGKAGKGSFWSRSHQFRKLCDWAFEIVDADKSGEVDKKELYSGLLLIHLNLASYMGPAACRPATREYVEDIFDKMDDDQSGALDRDEFADVMVVLCGQVMTRVVLQWSMTLMIVPLLAQYVLDGVAWTSHVAMSFWAGIDAVHLAWDHVTEMVAEAAERHVPGAAWTVWEALCRYWAMIPDSVLEVLPLTILSCVLGGIAVPYMLFRIDDFFHGMADKKKEGKKKQA